mgnify:CR=1 FL=1
MRVELASDLFPNPSSELHIHAICCLAFDGRHRLIIEDDQSPSFQKWLNSMSQPIQSQWSIALKNGYLFEAREPARRKLRVSDRPLSDWGKPIPDLTPSDAADYLTKPFRAVLEDWKSDRAFLIAVAQPEFREALQALERLGSLTFENGGGISNQAVKLKTDGALGSRETSRLWAMFDSDALSPGMPSNQAKFLEGVCQTHGIVHHRLTRRCIESYLPLDELRGWAYSKAKEAPARRPVFEAFLKLRDDQRHHFNLKAGFRGDEKRDDRTNAVPLYHDLDPGVRAALDTGFGGSIAEIFQSSFVDETVLRRDGSWAELNTMVRTLIELVR